MSEKDPADGVPEPVRPDVGWQGDAETRRERDERVDGTFAAAAEQEEERLESVRRRRAEPPPTVEREITATPGIELIVVLALLAGALAAGGFMAFYVLLPNNQMLGLTLGLALVFFAIAAVLAGKRLVPQEKVAEDYHWYGDEEMQEDVVEIVAESGEGITRRKLLAGATAVAGLSTGAAFAFPLASIGPNVGEKIYATPWRRGRRVVDESGAPVYADDVRIGMFLTAFPEGADREHLGAPVILIRVPESALHLPRGRDGSAPGGILAYSKICPHAGCAISMYRHPKYPPAGEPHDALICPCHYSTFDPLSGGRRLFGPAGRNLPQLPLQIDKTGVLVAGGDFYGPVGPSYGGIRLEGPGRT